MAYFYLNPNSKLPCRLTTEYREYGTEFHRVWQYPKSNYITPMETNEITRKILACAYKVHSELGPGLLESSYEECLHYELLQANFVVEKQKGLPLIYQAVKLDVGYRIDLFVENKVIIEIKSVESLTDVHVAQVLTYLKLSKCPVGLLLNFNVKSLKQGIRRLVNSQLNNTSSMSAKNTTA